MEAGHAERKWYRGLHHDHTWLKTEDHGLLRRNRQNLLRTDENFDDKISPEGNPNPDARPPTKFSDEHHGNITPDSSLGSHQVQPAQPEEDYSTTISPDTPGSALAGLRRYCATALSEALNELHKILQKTSPPTAPHLSALEKMVWFSNRRAKWRREEKLRSQRRAAESSAAVGGGPVHGRLAGPLAGYPGLSQPMAAAMQDSYSPMAAGMGSGPCLQQQHRDAASYSYMLHDTLGLGAYSRASANPAGQGGIAGGHPAAYAVSGASPHGAAGVISPGVTVPVQVPGQTTDLSVPSNYWPRLQ
nr:homeobox protein aristaless-like 3 [Rhipicephalus microplus]